LATSEKRPPPNSEQRTLKAFFATYFYLQIADTPETTPWRYSPSLTCIYMRNSATPTSRNLPTSTNSFRSV